MEPPPPHASPELQLPASLSPVGLGTLWRVRSLAPGAADGLGDGGERSAAGAGAPRQPGNDQGASRLRLELSRHLPVLSGQCP